MDYDYSIKDIFQIIYWFISLLILVITVYWIYKAPIKAIETGRKLDEEQNKRDAQENLFLSLYSLRGDPTHPSFVLGLNQIEIIYQDNKKVLDIWYKLFDSLHSKDKIEDWDILTTELLSEMSVSLGYKELKAANILRNYYIPKDHEDKKVNQVYQLMAQYDFLRSSHELNNLWINHLKSQKK